MSTQTHERDVPLDTFGNRLMLARAHAGHISISRAAELTGLGRGAWQNWERGTPPSNMAAVVEIIATSLNVDRDWLMWGGPLGSHQPGPNRPGLPTAAQGSGLRIASRNRRAELVATGDGTLVLFPFQAEPPLTPDEEAA